MLSNKKNHLSDHEIIEKGSRALIQELGYSGFLRFMKHTDTTGKEDYLFFEDQIFEQMSLEDIFNAAVNYWSQNYKK